MSIQVLKTTKGSCDFLCPASLTLSAVAACPLRNHIVVVGLLTSSSGCHSFSVPALLCPSSPSARAASPLSRTRRPGPPPAPAQRLCLCIGDSLHVSLRSLILTPTPMFAEASDPALWWLTVQIRSTFVVLQPHPAVVRQLVREDGQEGHLENGPREFLLEGLGPRGRRLGGVETAARLLEELSGLCRRRW